MSLSVDEGGGRRCARGECGAEDRNYKVAVPGWREWRRLHLGQCDGRGGGRHPAACLIGCACEAGWAGGCVQGGRWVGEAVMSD